MRVKSPFFEKSSARFILKRSRRLRILTFDKIKKTVFYHKIRTKRIIISQYAIILSKSNIPQKNVFKKFFMRSINFSCTNTPIKRLYHQTQQAPIEISTTFQCIFQFFTSPPHPANNAGIPTVPSSFSIHILSMKYLFHSP